MGSRPIYRSVSIFNNFRNEHPRIVSGNSCQSFLNPVLRRHVRTRPSATPKGSTFLEEFERRRKEREAKTERDRKALKESQNLTDDFIFNDADESSALDDPVDTTGLDDKPSQLSQAPRNPKNMATVLDPRPQTRIQWERKMLIRSIKRRGRLSKSELLKRTERESLSKSALIKTSVKKLSPLANQITGKSLEDALIQMRFSKKKAAKDVQDFLRYARDVAVVERGMGIKTEETEATKIRGKKGEGIVIKNPKDIYIDQAWVGASGYDMDLDYRARGRVHRMRLPYTRISVLLKEEATRIRQAKEREEKRKKRKLWVHLPNRPIHFERQYCSW